MRKDEMQDFTLKHHQANNPKKVHLSKSFTKKKPRVNGHLSIYFFFINIYFLNSQVRQRQAFWSHAAYPLKIQYLLEHIYEKGSQKETTGHATQVHSTTGT